ncbi:MAG: HlyD family efflux transporter periplasmic adaptor subunit [Pseudomonadota bacterium]
MPFRDKHIAHFKTLSAMKTPRIMRAVSVLLTVAIIGVVCFLIYAPWVQTTAGSGVVTALNPNDRQQDINAFVSGRIEEWFVRDGSVVSQGDSIVRIVDNDPQLIERLEAEREQVGVQLRAARTGLATAEIDLDRMRELFESGLAARRDYEQAQIRVEEFRGRVAEAAANLNRVDVNLSRQSVQLVTAPRDGVILSVNAGDAATYVNAGDILATFVPEAPERVVEIFVDGRDIALVQMGAKARIQFEGWPAVQFSGWPSVAVGTFGGIVTAVDPSAQPGGRFRVLISEDTDDVNPWPEERYVRFGATVRAWVLLETVPVGYELWRQLNNFPPELSQQVAATDGANNR